MSGRGDDRAVLRQIPVLEGLSSSQQEAVVATGRERSLEAGEILFSEGRPAEAFFAALDGRMKLVRYSPQGKELLLHLVRPGQSFAEAALFGAGTYPATAEAVVATRVLCFPRDRLVELLRGSPELALAMLASLSQWTRRMVSTLDLFTQRRVEERLAIYLLARSPQGPRGQAVELTLEDPRHLIAAQIGTAPEVLSRTFRRLEEDGLVNVAGSRITVRDPAGLRALADWIGDDELE